MFSEFLYLSINLGSFACLLWDILSMEPNDWNRKLKNLIYFILSSMILYLLVYTISQSDENIIHIKKALFGEVTFLIVLFVVVANISLLWRKHFYYPFTIAITSSPYLFFSLFGFEKFSVFGSELNSFSLLKVQNPLIFLFFISLYLIQFKKVQIILLSLGIISLLNYTTNRKKVFNIEEKNVFSKYIPYEFFFDRDGFVLESPPDLENKTELRGGLYVEKRSDSPEADRLYQFNLRSIRKLENKHRQKIQMFVSMMDFPIVVNDNGMVTISDVYRSLEDQKFKIILDTKTEKIQMLGPLF